MKKHQVKMFFLSAPGSDAYTFEKTINNWLDEQSKKVNIEIVNILMSESMTNEKETLTITIHYVRHVV